MKKPRDLQSQLIAKLSPNTIPPGEGLFDKLCVYAQPVSHKAKKLFHCSYHFACASKTNLYNKTYCERELSRVTTG